MVPERKAHAEYRNAKLSALIEGVLGRFMEEIVFTPAQLRTLTMEGRLTRAQRMRVCDALRVALILKLSPLLDSSIAFARDGTPVWSSAHVYNLLTSVRAMLLDAGNTPEASVMADALVILSEEAYDLDDWFDAKTPPRTPVRTATLPKQLPTVVCLCGSTRFYDVFQRANYEETMRGKIVLTVGFFAGATDAEHSERLGCKPEQKTALDELHKRKIDIADEILVLNVDGYIGKSTRSEIEYAVEHDKRVRWWDEDKRPDWVPEDGVEL